MTEDGRGVKPLLRAHSRRGFPILVLEFDKIAAGVVTQDVFGAVGDGRLPASLTSFGFLDRFFSVGGDDAKFCIGQHDEDVRRMRVQAQAADVLARVGVVFDDAGAVVFEEDLGGLGDGGFRGTLGDDAGEEEAEATGEQEQQG
ncbi:MAG: hypothetical protein EXS38_04700 [Opitutus sp.]|nr:hypothetical protein [Opitutus sp.]